MGVMDYPPDTLQNDETDNLKPSLCMIWNKLLELEVLIHQMMQEIKKTTP